jgi:hypothetical protein
MSNQFEELRARIEALESANPRLSGRYPYTYACDYMRSHFGIDSRSDASQKMVEIAELLGQKNHRYLAIAFAEAFLAESS